MAINNKDKLSDQDLIVGTSELTDLSSSWNKEILDVGLSSLNISGAFSALTGQGIGASYIESLENAIKKAEQNALNVSKMIASTASDQDNADQKGAKDSDGNPYGSGGGGGGGGGYRGGGGGGSKDKDKPDVGIDSKDDTEEQKLTEDELVKVVKEFISIYNGDLSSVLFDQSYASKVKSQLLESPNLSKETKEVISKLDPKVIQTYLQDLMLSGAGITGFSKLVVTVFEQDLKNKNTKASVFDASKNISEVYSEIAGSNDAQGKIRDLYNGSAAISDVDDNTIYFTRDFIDTIAAASNVSSDELLNNTQYKESLMLEVKDIANTFTVIEEANNRDSKTKSTLYSNIIVKQEG